MVRINSDTVKESILHPNQQIFTSKYIRKNFKYYEDINKKLSEDEKLVGNENFITILRSFNYFQDFRHNLTICINIKEDYFRSIYNNDEAGKNYLTYVINSDGKIVSHPDSLQINTASKSFDKDKMKDNSGAFIYEENSISKQVVFRRFLVLLSY